MAEVAGLALGVLGIAGLFTSCMENFDIIVRARDFGEEFDLMCTQLSLQRIRLALWGETLGLLPSLPERRRVPYNSAIDREDIKPSITASLHQLLNLLTKAEVITERYALECTSFSAHSYEEEVAETPRGMLVLRDSFQRFKERIRKNQKQKSVWKVTRWSIHDYAQFEALVENIRKLLDGLESITNALGVLERQRELLLQEVESESDARSLSLLQDIGSLDSAPAALRAVSETASIRLTLLSGDSQSYHTAKTKQTGQTGSSIAILRLRQEKAMSKVLQMETHSTNGPQTDIAVDHSETEEHPTAGLPLSDTSHVTPQTDEFNDANDTIPQHQRWMSALLASRPVPIPQHQRWTSALLASRPDTAPAALEFPGDKNYGKGIGYFKASDDQVYRETCGKLLSQANAGLSLAKRMFIELRNIHRAAMPFITAVPIGDALDKILACIEGPPGTPYKGGIFWITIRLHEQHPPAMRFQTRIYHPNIDHTGKICADHVGWWQSAKALNKKPRVGGSLRRDLPEFSEYATNHYSLVALLVALCELLASPNVEDPLVPEIAETFVTDYKGYWAAARLYTNLYAKWPRPAEDALIFSYDDEPPTEDSTYKGKASFAPNQSLPRDNGNYDSLTYEVLETQASWASF
ncbi:ubiquitin-conjugating enzyme E2-16 kDa [Apiospora rasikravindrae]|uniref:Ubiquitin-conjugating enzyme E2-16 kDa n=1 Tax=Apiospora rasikravindrae TaxID=990691 RepID=A0ABR1S342_9PEZI